ncbi:hypothetical protein L195_g034088 [Trifolium pratense]|uniref:Uncharacterized protein n=1 Tax=Trifolium pratense TaxID=57577 RepID=A0A2K3LHX6_TRIPR|nr:hypothetical protein L195_g034088 [Trifolium pratense]
MLGFKETNDFGKYLGVPPTGRAPKRGRLTLAKSVIEAVPIYPMMSTKIPKSCLDEIQRIQCQFIWGDTEQKRKFHVVGWDRFTVPKWMGGLGIFVLVRRNSGKTKFLQMLNRVTF